MRILFVVPYPPSSIRVRPYHFIHELARRHEVSVLASALGRETADWEPLRSVCRRVDVIPVSRSVALRNCIGAGLAGYPLQAAVSQHPGLARRARELLSAEQFDVVHVEHLRAARIVSAIPPDVPTLYDAVDCISLLLERTMQHSHSRAQRILSRIELARTRAFEASLLTQFDRVIATSPEDATALERIEPSRRVEVVTNGVDLDHLRPATGPPEPATIVLSGKMSYHANITAVMHFVRNILPRVRTARPEVQVRIVGSNPPPLIRSLSRDPGITVTGYVSDMRAALADATVAVCPVTLKVGVQNKVLEAMALGVPVVCTRAGFQGLTAQPGRDLLVADTDAEFADNVCRVLAQHDLRDEIGRAGRHYVEANHCWEVIVRKLESCYADAISHHKRELQPARLDGRLSGRSELGEREN